MSTNPTTDIYNALDHAYQHYNDTLFNGSLPNCVLVMHRKKGALGYFWQEQWSDGADHSAHEIALNPDHMRARTINETLSTLVHEMCHLEQAHIGKPSRNGYHNKQWADYMKAVGLLPYNVKEPTKESGQSCSHNIEDGGHFYNATAQLLADGYEFPWSTIDQSAARKGKKKTANKTKFECGECGANAWGKATLNIECGDCHEPMWTAG